MIRTARAPPLTGRRSAKGKQAAIFTTKTPPRAVPRLAPTLAPLVLATPPPRLRPHIFQHIMPALRLGMPHVLPSMPPGGTCTKLQFRGARCRPRSRISATARVSRYRRRTVVQEAPWRPIRQSHESSRCPAGTGSHRRPADRKPAQRALVWRPRRRFHRGRS